MFSLKRITAVTALGVASVFGVATVAQASHNVLTPVLGIVVAGWDYTSDVATATIDAVQLDLVDDSVDNVQNATNDIIDAVQSGCSGFVCDVIDQVQMDIKDDLVDDIQLTVKDLGNDVHEAILGCDSCNPSSNPGTVDDILASLGGTFALLDDSFLINNFFVHGLLVFLGF